MFRGNAGIDASYTFSGGGGLRLADILLSRVELAVKIIFVKNIAVDENEPSDAGTGKNLRYPAAKPAAADHSRAGFKQPRLPLKAKGTDRALITRWAKPSAQRGNLRLSYGQTA